MKNIPAVKYIPVFTAVIFLFSCKKYPEGPSFSLRTRTSRLAGNWRIEQLLFNGQDVTTYFYPNKEFFESFTRSGEYTYDDGSLHVQEDGTWKWIKEQTQVYKSVSYNKTITILKLQNKSLWYSWGSSGSEYEMHLVPN